MEPTEIGSEREFEGEDDMRFRIYCEECELYFLPRDMTRDAIGRKICDMCESNLKE